MKIRHYFSFDENANNNMHSDRLDVDNWNALRTYEDGGPFSLEKTRERWVSNCEYRNDYKQMAEKLLSTIRNNGWTKVTSLGVGKGILEYHLKKMMPELEIVCSDYTKRSMDLLSELFVEGDGFETFDMLQDDYSSLAKRDAVIVYRLSTEFDKEQWKDIFLKMHEFDVKNIFFVPADFLTVKTGIQEKLRYFLNTLQHRRNTFCGWMYTRNEYLKFFMGNNTFPLYQVVKSCRYGDTEIFELKKYE